MSNTTLACRVCGKVMRAFSASANSGDAAHRECRLKNPLHGTTRTYRSGCRCDECRAAKSAENQRAIGRHRDKHGIVPSTAQRQKFREKHGFWPNARGSDWISPQLRLELYERDGWDCYLCERRVDRNGDPNGGRAPSLDHIMPRSLGGSDDPSNLKTACRSCNSRKGAALLVSV